MFRRIEPPPPEDAPDELEEAASSEPSAVFKPFGPGGPDLSALPIAGITLAGGISVRTAKYGEE